MRFTDERRYFVSEATVYRLLKAQDLITSPAYIVVKAADEFRDKTTAPNQLWQTDFTYLKVVWLGLVLPVDGAGRLLALHRGVEAVHDDAGRATSPPRSTWRWRPPGSITCGWCIGHGCSPTTDRATSRVTWLTGSAAGHDPHPRCPAPSADAGQDRALAPDAQEPHPARTRLPARRTGGAGVAFVEHYNHLRAHESLGNLTPADVYFGRGEAILLERERIKRKTIQNRRLLHHKQAA